MASRFIFLFLSLLSLTSPVSAAIVSIDFTAHIYETTGDGMGYQNGDLISGSFVIDPSMAEGKSVDEPTQVSLYGSVFSPFVQSSFSEAPTADYRDHLDIYNNSDVFGDLISITKTIDTFDFTLELMGISFQYLNLDWISDFELNNINLVASEGGYSNGMFARFDLLNDWAITDSARFWLDTLTITSAPVSVPEPAPLVLLLIAFAGLVARRRFI